MIDVKHLQPVKLTKAQKQQMEADADTPARRERGKIFLLDGVGGDNRLPRKCRLGLLAAGMPDAMEIFSWQLGWAGLWLGDVMNLRRNRLQAALLRRRIRAYRRQYPGRPVRLIGHSAGAAIIAFCMEKLPPGTVRDAVLLSPGLSPHYDLARALAAVGRRAICVWSPIDLFMIGFGTLLFGTADRKWTFAAGVTSFQWKPEKQTPEQRRQYSKLTQIGWSPDMMKLEWYGLHNSSASTSFSARVLAPMLERTGPVQLLQVDAFTDRPFAGNPAGVCLMDGPGEADWMQAVAAEMNLSETAFLWPQGDGWSLRWFTPACEVTLCGHATLASAHALWDTGRLPADKPAKFHTASGLLTCRRAGDRIEMDFPATPPKPVEPPEGMLDALGVQAKAVVSNGMDFLVELPDAQAVREVSPDFRWLKRLDTRGVMVTARSDDPAYDFISRFFAPGVGIDEDPVTGSAHCLLGPYWQGRLGKSDLAAYQASKRGGRLGVTVRGDRVLLRGQAVTVFRGELL